jgi:hypothetical protein
MRKRFSMTYLGFAFVCLNALAQAPPKTVASLSDAVLIACPQIAEPLLTAPFVARLMQRHPIDVAAVCSCAAKETLADPAFASLKALTFEDEELETRMSDPDLAAYFAVRALQTSMECFSNELRSRLDEARAFL